MPKYLMELTGKPYGTILVHNYPGKRTVLDRDCIPEFSAWLLMHGKRCERMLESALHYSQKTSDAYIQGVRRAMECRTDCIRMLMSCLSDKFSRTDFEESYEEICQSFNIQKFTYMDGYIADCEVFIDGEGI